MESEEELKRAIQIYGNQHEEIEIRRIWSLRAWLYEYLFLISVRVGIYLFLNYFHSYTLSLAVQTNFFIVSANCMKCDSTGYASCHSDVGVVGSKAMASRSGHRMNPFFTTLFKVASAEKQILFFSFLIAQPHIFFFIEHVNLPFERLNVLPVQIISGDELFSGQVRILIFRDDLIVPCHEPGDKNDGEVSEWSLSY